MTDPVLPQPSAATVTLPARRVAAFFASFAPSRDPLRLLRVITPKRHDRDYAVFFLRERESTNS
jgi:hypothetical protein